MSNIPSIHSFMPTITVIYKKLDQIKLFKDEDNINELMGFPEGFYEKRGKRSPFIVLSESYSNENFNSDIFVMKI